MSGKIGIVQTGRDCPLFRTFEKWDCLPSGAGLNHAGKSIEGSMTETPETTVEPSGILVAYDDEQEVDKARARASSGDRR